MSFIFIFVKGSVISLEKIALEKKSKIVLLVNSVLGQKFTKDSKI